MNRDNKIIFKNIISSRCHVSEKTLKNDYEKKYENIVENLKYIRDVHGIKNITFFEKNYEGFELLKNAHKVTIIVGNKDIVNKRIVRRINKLRQINKKVNVNIEEEIRYGGGGGGLLQLIAYGNQDIYLRDDAKITYFKVKHNRQYKQNTSVTNISKINKNTNKINKTNNFRKNKINKNANKMQHRGR